MSASTGTIQRPMAQGPILRAIALGLASVFAAGALAWGALTLGATKAAVTPVAAPAQLDKGSRFDTPQGAPVPYQPGKPGNVTPRFENPVSHPRGFRAS